MDNIKYVELCKVFCINVVNVNGEDKENVERDILFCRIEKLCIQNFYFELYMLMLEEKFFCLNMILENLEMLKFLQYIEGIFQWYRLLVMRCSYSLKKVDCKYMFVGLFIN